jgi:hypothetical protein
MVGAAATPQFKGMTDGATMFSVSALRATRARRVKYGSNCRGKLKRSTRSTRPAPCSSCGSSATKYRRRGLCRDCRKRERAAEKRRRARDLRRATQPLPFLVGDLRNIEQMSERVRLGLPACMPAVDRRRSLK